MLQEWDDENIWKGKRDCGMTIKLEGGNNHDTILINEGNFCNKCKKTMSKCKL